MKIKDFVGPIRSLEDSMGILPAPPPLWDLAECQSTYPGHTVRRRLLDEGWEPFAVDHGTIWFRRLVPQVTP